MSRRNKDPQSNKASSVKKVDRRANRGRYTAPDTVMYDVPELVHAPCEPLFAMTVAQSRYMTAIEQNIVTFGTGPAGTGKSYIAVAMACEALTDKRIDKIIITRPAIEVGKAFGALPGELEDKYAPYFNPVREILNERLGRSQVEYLLKRKRIEAVPLEYMLGTTFKDTWVILDEAQNATREQMEMFLTRIGGNSKVIIDGSMRQKYIRQESGLFDAMQRLTEVRKIAMVEFSVEDVVRSGIVRDIIRAYEA